MFLDTKHAVDRLTKHLLASGVRAAALHGGKSQPQRTRTLDQFKTGHVTVLVATNVAARGIHVDDLDLVVNVDPPTDHKDYLHRGGRTARAGESGSVVTLVLPDQRREMTRLMADAGITPRTTQVSSGDEELTRITGARSPPASRSWSRSRSRPRRSSGHGRAVRVPARPAPAVARSRVREPGAGDGGGPVPARGAGGAGGGSQGGGAGRSGGAAARSAAPARRRRAGAGRPIPARA